MKLNELSINNILDFLLQLININEVKLIIISIFILSLGLIFKPVIKDMLSILLSKIKIHDRDKEKEDL
uniref:BlyA n=1 Tax=Borrelia hermsii TaxID=140 RepID=Q9FBB3_BORHE|nr:BlyA [Borrelia hermsii]